MYPSYHSTPDLSRLHQSEIRAQRDAIRQARRAKAEQAVSDPKGPSLWERMTKTLARVPQMILRSRPAGDPRPAFRSVAVRRG